MDELVLRNIMGNLRGDDYINFATTCKKYRVEFYDKYTIKISIYSMPSQISLENIKHLQIRNVFFDKKEAKIFANAKKLQSLSLYRTNLPIDKNFNGLLELKISRGYDVKYVKLPQSLKYFELENTAKRTFELPLFLEKFVVPNNGDAIRKLMSTLPEKYEIVEQIKTPFVCEFYLKPKTAKKSTMNSAEFYS